jgi:hypothetical protein
MSRFPLVFTRRFPPEPVVPEYRPRPHRHLCEHARSRRTAFILETRIPRADGV